MESGGCLGCIGGAIKFALLLCLAYALYAWVAPASPPEHSYLVHADERTYIELETEQHIDWGGWDRPTAPSYWTTNIYYTRLGGWFGRPRRILIAKVDSGDREDELAEAEFQRSSEGGYVAPVYISVVNNWFTPPRHFPDDTVTQIDWKGRAH
jgi:hypothetical protein